MFDDVDDAEARLLGPVNGGDGEGERDVEGVEVGVELFIVVDMVCLWVCETQPVSM